MFEGLDARLLSDPEFKEDSVRELILAPMLARLGYSASGPARVTRSKSLVHPFVFVGTRQHPVTIIPDYTLYASNQPVLVLDAKSPKESVTDNSHIQQAYSYAIHPEIRAQHFALCNGHRLVVHSIATRTPCLDIAFEEYEPRWSDIEKYLAPQFLLYPELRGFAPDFGMAVSRLGMSAKTNIIMLQTRLGTFARVTDDCYSASVNLEFADRPHSVSFDFTTAQLPLMLSGLPRLLRNQFLSALSRFPFQACADLALEVDLHTHLGEEIHARHEVFIPLIVDRITASRFNTTPAGPDACDFTDGLYHLSSAFRDKQDPTDPR